MGLFDSIIRKPRPDSLPQPKVERPVLPIYRPRLPSELTVDLDSESPLFYSTDLGFALYNRPLERGTILQVGERIPVACMFEIHWLTLNKEKIGYLFNSQFQVTNKGGYILTYTNSGAGKASAVEVLVKTDTLVIYHFPNHGTLIVSPHIGQDIQTILDSQ